MKLKTILIFLIVLNAVAVSLFLYVFSILKGTIKRDSGSLGEPLYFVKPIASYHLLKIFDSYEPIEDKYFKIADPPHARYSEPRLGLDLDFDYCNKVRAYFIDYPQYLFFEQYFLTDHRHNSTVREAVIPAIGSDLMPDVHIGMKKYLKEERIYQLRPWIMNFFTIESLHTFQSLGRSFGCINQMYNHIPGNLHFQRKDYQALALREYSEQYKAQPQCFNFSTNFPRSWLLNRASQCKEFFEKYLNVPSYNEIKSRNKFVYMLKKSHGRQYTSSLLTTNEEENLRDLYNNGTNCGEEASEIMVQYYIPNFLTLYGHKFQIKAYMFIASTSPSLVYYHDGYVKVNLELYDPNQADIQKDISQELIKRAENGEQIYGMNVTELKKFHIWTYEELDKYLWNNERIDQKSWTNAVFRKELKRLMIHVYRATSAKLLNRSTVYEILTLDFIMDDELKLWFIDSNTNPYIERGLSHETEILLKSMLNSVFEITLGLTRSRMKRIIRFINEVGAEIAGNEDIGNLYIPGLDIRREEWRKIIKNKFEMEYSPGMFNKMQKIVDENQDGKGRYEDLLTDECI